MVLLPCQGVAWQSQIHRIYILSFCVSNPDLLSSIEKWVHPKTIVSLGFILVWEAEKISLIRMSLMSEGHWLYQSYKELSEGLTSWDSTTCSRISNSSLKAVPLNASPDWNLRFSGVMMGVFWKESRSSFQSTQSPNWYEWVTAKSAMDVTHLHALGTQLYFFIFVLA